VSRRGCGVVLGCFGVRARLSLFGRDVRVPLARGEIPWYGSCVWGCSALLLSCVCVFVCSAGRLQWGSARSTFRPQSMERPREGTFRPRARNSTLRDHSENERSMLAACLRRMRSSSSLTEMDMARRRALCSATRRYGFRRMSTSRGSIGASTRSASPTGTVLTVEGSTFTSSSLLSGLV
jgi:hypothetical protein